MLLAALVLISVAFCAFWIGGRPARSRSTGPASPGITRAGIGFITNFFDTLGISSFATTTTMLRARRLVDDMVIPGTLNVGHFLPTVAQALIYITIVEVEFTTLALLIAGAVGGSWIGAAIVAGLNRRAVQRGMGVALVVASVLLVLSALGRLPGGGVALGPRRGQS